MPRLSDLGAFLALCALIPVFSNALSDPSDEETSLDREKRSFQFGFVVGETILDIQCKRGYLTVCAPDGPDACPVGYASQTNVGQCGFATLNHYLNTTNIAGTCCFKLAGSSSVTTTTAASGTNSSSNSSLLIPQIIAYPVYAQYPYAIGGSTATGTTGTGTTGTGTSSNYGSASYGSSPTSSSSSYGSSPSSSVSYGSSPSPSPSPSPSTSYGSSTGTSSATYGREWDGEPLARQYSSSPTGTSSSYGSSVASPSSSSYGSTSNSGYGSSSVSSPSSGTSGTSGSSLVFNPTSLAYPPLLQLTSIPTPNGSLFNPFPPAMNVAVYGSSTSLANGLQSLLAQLIGSTNVPQTVISAVQNALILALNTPGCTAQLISLTQTATAQVSALSGLNAAVGTTVSSVNSIVGGGCVASSSVTTTAASTVTSMSANGSVTVTAGSGYALSIPSLAPQLRIYYNALQSTGVSQTTLTSLGAFIAAYEVSPVLTPCRVIQLQQLLTAIQGSSGLTGVLVQSTTNLQTALAAYSTYNGNSNTVQLLQTLYTLSATNKNLDPNVFNGLGALVAQTAGSTSTISNTNFVRDSLREITRYVGESYQTPLVQLILAKVINCRVSNQSGTPQADKAYMAICGLVSNSNCGTTGGSTPTSAPVMSYYNSPSSGSSYGSSTGTGTSSGYGSSPTSSVSYSASPAQSSYSSPSPSPGMSTSYESSPSTGTSYSSSPSTSSSYGSSNYGSSGTSTGSSGSSSNAPSVTVNQGVNVTSAINGTVNGYPYFLPIYPVLPLATGGTGTGTTGTMTQTLPASNNSAYNYGYPTGLPQYPVLPYYVNTQGTSSMTGTSGSSYGGSTGGTSYSASPASSSYGTPSTGTGTATQVGYGPYPTGTSAPVVTAAPVATPAPVTPAPVTPAPATPAQTPATVATSATTVAAPTTGISAVTTVTAAPSVAPTTVATTANYYGSVYVAAPGAAPVAAPATNTGTGTMTGTMTGTGTGTSVGGSSYGSSPVGYNSPASMVPGPAAVPSAVYGGSSYGGSVASPATPVASSPSSYGGSSSGYQASPPSATPPASVSSSGYGATPPATVPSSGYGASPVAATPVAGSSNSYGASPVAATPVAGPSSSYGASPVAATPVAGSSSSYGASPSASPSSNSASSYGGSSYGGSPAPAPGVTVAPGPGVTTARTTAAPYGAYPVSGGTNTGNREQDGQMNMNGNRIVAEGQASINTNTGMISGNRVTVEGDANSMMNVGMPSNNMGSPFAPEALMQGKALDQCGIPHASQQGDIAFLMANAQKSSRASIYRSKRDASNGREARITNSMVAKEMEVCWMAAILLDGKYQSGASIVSEWFVLTAAHEVDGRDPSRLRIRVGDTDVRQNSLDRDERPGCIQDIAVDKIITHPDFDRKTLANDIGLLRLKQPLNLNSPCVCKICLQEEQPQEGETCIVSGFGSTRVVDPSKTKTEEEAFALSGPNAEILRYAGIPVVANDVCSAAFKNERLAPKLKAPFGVLDDTQLCAGGISQRDACYGDGGSPLVCFNGKSFYQAGVVSYGRGCGKALMAAVYGSVTAASPWLIEQIITDRPSG